MNRIWMMALLSLKDSLRAKAWIPLFGMSVLAWVPLLAGFGPKLTPNAFANNIISSYFAILSFGVYVSGLILGATSMPSERRASVMFTLPISRTEIVAGKLLGTQMIVACGLLIGYLVSLALAVHFDLAGFAYSRLGLATALTISFTYLCLSIPLGFWLSPVPAGLMAVVLINVPSTLKDLVDHQWITAGWLVRVIEVLRTVMPGQVDPVPLSKAFYDNYVDLGDYVGVGRDAFLALVFFMLLSALAQRKELSTKS